MPMTLPDHATPISRQLHAFAARLAESCPPALGDEIALVGSAAMGLSDAQSDLDLNLWTETIPPEAERIAWLTSCGGTAFNVQPPRPDDSYGVACVIDGVDVGCSWQTFTQMDAYVERILAGETLDEGHEWLALLASVLAQAIPLRTSGRVAAVQARLARYPDAVRERGCLALSRHISGVLKSLPKAVRYRDDRGVTLQTAVWIGDIVEALYPINRRWHPQSKWKYRLAGDLPIQPDALHERMRLALHDPDLHGRALHAASLLRDTLALVQADYDVRESIAALEAFIADSA